MELIKYAKEELERAGLFSEKGDFYGGLTGKCVMELVEVFSKQNHSGMSASLVSNIFHRLVRFEPLTPLTGDESEWQDNQNKRCPAVFRDEKGAYYLNAIVWKDEKGRMFTGNVGGISSVQRIKFPFIPKTFIVEVKGDKIVDKKTLKRALNYYKAEDRIFRKNQTHREKK